MLLINVTLFRIVGLRTRGQYVFGVPFGHSDPYAGSVSRHERPDWAGPSCGLAPSRGRLHLRNWLLPDPPKRSVHSVPRPHAEIDAQRRPGVKPRSAFAPNLLRGDDVGTLQLRGGKGRQDGPSQSLLLWKSDQSERGGLMAGTSDVSLPSNSTSPSGLS